MDQPLRGFAQFRDLTAERAAVDHLELPTHLLPQMVGTDRSPRNLHLTGQLAVTLLDEAVPWLQEHGTTVEIRGDAPDLRETRADPLIEFRVSDSEDDSGRTDW